jgi:catechol 2,3-dioxygenase-like lactoylglutathione lyase family enzyme
MGIWYSRPVLCVADIAAAKDFYVGKLGFAEKWRHEQDVAQFDRDECEITVASHRPGKNGAAMLFVELTQADFAALPGMLADNNVAFRRGHWSYPVIIVEDPDGNRLYFPDPADPGSTAQNQRGGP